MNIKINERNFDFFLNQKMKDLINSNEFIGTTYEFNAYYVLKEHKAKGYMK